MKNLAKLMLPALAVLALAAPAATAAPETRTATEGQVSASVDWDQTDNRGARNVRISITRAGAELVKNQRVQPGCQSFCGVPPGDDPLRIRDLNADGEPEVLLDLYTGGAHCCSILLIFEFDPVSGSYDRIRRNFGNAGYVLRDIGRDGRVELQSTDDRFSYLYTSYLESARPLQVFRYSAAGALVDVTRRFDGRIRSHKRSLGRFIKRLRREGDLDLRGVYAAWQADNYLLGRRAAARGWRTLRKAARRGDLNAVGANRGPEGKRYLRSLRAKLGSFGYIR